MEEIRDKVTAAIMAEVRDYTSELPPARPHEEQLTEVIRTLVSYAMFKARGAPVAEI